MRFYFAWVNDTDTVFHPGFVREDEKIFSFELSQTEGEFAGLKIEMQNTYGVGILSPTRKRWAWFSLDMDESTGGTTDGIIPLFFGRVVGVPADLQAETITLEFLARPKDWDAQRNAVANSLRVLPYYDPVWFNAEGRANPDSVLEGYPKLWHIDRVTHVVTASDILNGEDGTLDVRGDFFRDSLSVGYGQVPARRVSVTATVQWEQQATGTVVMTDALIKAFHTIGGTRRPFVISSYTGEGLMDDWPKKGDNIGAGWTIGESSIIRVDGRINPAGEQVVVQMENGLLLSFPLFLMAPKLNVDYTATRSRKEQVTFVLDADVQPLLTDPGDDEAIQLSVESSEIDQPIDAGGALPIGVLSRRTYFQTPRGWQSIENLIARARAQLLVRARTVAVKFQIPWSAGLELSCRKNVRILDDRLPCGTCTGKVISYSLHCTGDDGTCWVDVTIGCAIGEGNTVTDAPGDPTYVVDGYVADGYQVRANRIVMPIPGAVTFVPPEGIPINDDGINFDDMRAATVLLPIEGTHTEPDEPGIDVIFGEAAQHAVIRAGNSVFPIWTPAGSEGFDGPSRGPDAAAVLAAFNTAYTTVRMNLIPLTRGPFENDYAITVSNLMVPKYIDLECDGVDTETTVP